MIPLTEKEHNKRIGQAIFHFRVNYKNPNKKNPPIMTQDKLAKRIFVTFQQVQKYEKGTNGTSSYRILQIAEALGVSVSDIFLRAYSDHKDFKVVEEKLKNFNKEIIGHLKPYETIAEIEIKDEQPLILKKEWEKTDEKKN